MYCKTNNKLDSTDKVMIEVFRGIFDHYHEKLFLAHSQVQGLEKFLKKHIRLKDEASLQEALHQGRGVILVTGHFGAVEFLPAVLAAHGYPVSIIMRFQTQSLQTSLLQRATLADLELIDADKGNVLVAALKALKQGRILITECDEFEQWRPNPKQEINFLGSSLAYDRTLDILQLRSGAPVILALVKREEEKRYQLHFSPIATATGPEKKGVGEQCLELLEAAIYAAPGQWYQWKEFGKMIYPHLKENSCEYQANKYLASEVALYHAH